MAATEDIARKFRAVCRELSIGFVYKSEPDPSYDKLEQPQIRVLYATIGNKKGKYDRGKTG